MLRVATGHGGFLLFNSSLVPEDGDVVLYLTKAGSFRTASIFATKLGLCFDLCGVDCPVRAVCVLGVASDMTFS